MPSLEQFLERAFDVGHRFLDALSLRWREHTNRRTIIIIILVGALTAYAYTEFIEPPEAFPVGRLVTIDEGTPLKAVALDLEKEEVVQSAFALRLLVEAMGGERKVHAGDYLFKEPRDLFSVARALVVGAYGLEPIRIRVPEGATVAQMARLFGPQLQRFDAERFLAEATPKEGYFFPDTYFFLPNATDKTVEEVMRNNFEIHVATIEREIASSTRSLDEIVVMASILEREAYNTKDRRIIAGVLYNRLARGMPLQVDVTFAYTIGKGTFQLTLSDLTSDSPYNTYRYKGLPPGAIGSPSLDSLLAAATPIKNDYLYFLADHQGITHYCKNYACQLANKRRYF